MAKKCVACDKAKKMAKGGSTSAFAKLAPPYNKITFADKIAGAKKKMGGTLAKKNMGGDDTISPTPIYSDVSKNSNYTKSSNTDKDGNPYFIRKAGYSGPSKATKGTVGPTGEYSGIKPVVKPVVKPNMVNTYGVNPTSKKGGAVMSKKKMGGTTKAKKK
jgi:hypothetical protein